jgi:hypothetical protein
MKKQIALCDQCRMEIEVINKLQDNKVHILVELMDTDLDFCSDYCAGKYFKEHFNILKERTDEQLNN